MNRITYPQFLSELELQELSMSKKFTCHHCNEVFASERNFELHIEFYHDGEKPYKCLKCDFSFFQKEELGTHITSVHDDTSLDIDTFNCELKEYLETNFESITSVHEIKKTL